MSEKLSDRVLAFVAEMVGEGETHGGWALADEVRALEASLAAALVERGQADAAYVAASTARVEAESLAATLRRQRDGLKASLPPCGFGGCVRSATVATHSVGEDDGYACDGCGAETRDHELPWAALVREIEREKGGGSA